MNCEFCSVSLIPRQKDTCAGGVSRGACCQDGGQRDIAEYQRRHCENHARNLESIRILDKPAENQTQPGPAYREKEYEADHVHPVAGGRGQFRHQGLQRAAGHGGRREK